MSSAITNIPRHIAVIMDGNGRWATARGMDRSYGHHKGAQRVPPLVEHCSELGVEALTLYSFSTENWTRSQDEVDFLMALCVEFLMAQRQSLLDNNIQFRHVGHREGLPPEVIRALDETAELTKSHTGMTLCLAINYGARSEITEAVRDIARKVAAGELVPNAIDEQTISNHLFTAGLPDPDLLIRTAGELRVSNYLLWQISYAEMYVADVCWPEFDLEAFDKALSCFKGRTRKFGAVVS